MSKAPDRDAGPAARDLGQPEGGGATDADARSAVEGAASAAEGPSGSEKRGSETADPTPPAGTHARPDLQNHDATPGAGTLPAGGDDDVETATG